MSEGLKRKGTSPCSKAYKRGTYGKTSFNKCPTFSPHTTQGAYVREKMHINLNTRQSAMFIKFTIVKKHFVRISHNLMWAGGSPESIPNPSVGNRHNGGRIKSRCQMGQG